MQDNTPAQGEESRKIHHEDIEVGKTTTFGHKVITKDEIIAFGRTFDPQPMHVDEEAAKASPVGGLCASGWHTCGIMMRMICDGILGQTAGLGSPGVDEVRWTKPVRPGDVLSCRHVCIEKRDLASRPDVGLSKLRIELVDAKGNVLCWWQTNQLTRKRNPGVAAPAPAGTSRPPRPALASLWDLASQPPMPTHTLFFEDRQIGEIADLGSHTFTKDEVIAFARQFDPQPFHLDEAAAKASLFGGLSASGWHTSAIFIRQVVRHRLAGGNAAPATGERLPAYGPSPGFRDLRWPKPVLVGDTITYRARLAEKIDLKSRLERGILASEVQGRNQNGQIVFALTSQILVDRRTPFRPA